MADTRKPREPLETDDGGLDVENRLKFVDLKNLDAVAGDESDGNVEWTWKNGIAAYSLCCMYTGPQTFLYFVTGALSYVTKDLGTSSAAWLSVAATLSIAAIAPFVGYLQDLLGRRYIALMGLLFACIGAAIIGSAHSFVQAIVGMTFGGIGQGICELAALAGLSEIVPVRKRGLWVSIMSANIAPFIPYVLYAQLLAVHATWRWGLWISLIYNFLVFLGLLLTYFPHDHPRAEGISRMTVLRDIDYVGGVLSIVGFTIFLVGLQAGGFSHSWTSAYVLCTILIGLASLTAFFIWEWKFAAVPIVPFEIFKGQYIIGLAFIIAFVAGMNFYVLLSFFPLTFTALYDPDPIQVGLKALGSGLSITAGAVFYNFMLSVWVTRHRELLLSAIAIMTAFAGSLSLLTPLNVRTTVALGVIGGFGVGGVVVPCATIALFVTPDALLATTAALSLSIRLIGGSIGYTIYYNIFDNKLRTRLPAYVAKYAVNAGLPLADADGFVKAFLGPDGMGPGMNVSMNVLEAARLGQRWAYADSLRYVWYTSVPFGVLAFACCVFLPRTEKYMTNRVAVRLRR